MRKIHINLIFVSTLVLLGSASFSAAKPPLDETPRFNVLFIAVDDLKPLLGCYGDKHVKTPHLDRLAKSGAFFESAYCQVALCGPSRVSIMTGRYPDATGIYSMGPPNTWLRKRHPNILTMPQYFKQRGYHTASIGKIFDARNFEKGGTDRIAWSERARLPRSTGNDPWGKQLRGGYLDQRNADNIRAGWREVQEVQRKAAPGSLPPFFKTPILKRHKARPAVENIDVPDHAYADGKMARWGQDRLKKFAAGKEGKPFFLAIGFLKPHLPFVAPQKYWELYDRDALPFAKTANYPKDMPDCAELDYHEGRTYSGVPDLGEPVPDATHRLLLHGYLACISYIDAQIGLLMDTLKETGLDNNTVVVVWGDHGFHTGDHGLWGKHTNWEQAVRVPLIIRAPGMRSVGGSTSHVESTDVFPTLCELTGQPTPKELDGKSLVPLLENPEASIRPYAASLYLRNRPDGSCLGYTIRHGRHRYIAWYPIRRTPSGSYRVIGKPIAAELYDYEADVDETHNLSGIPQYKTVEAKLQKLLQSHVSYTQDNQL